MDVSDKAGPVASSCTTSWHTRGRQKKLFSCSALRCRDSGAPAEKDVLRRVRNTKIYACVVTWSLGGTAFCVDSLYRRHIRQHPLPRRSTTSTLSHGGRH